MKRRIMAAALIAALTLLPCMVSFADERPVASEAGGIQVNGGVTDGQSEWNLVDERTQETETEREETQGTVREARAGETGTVTGGYGEKITWSLDLSSGVITFSGSGDMPAIYGSSSDELNPYRKQITSVVIGNGITSVGDSAFRGCTNLESVSLPESVIRIGRSAFQSCEGLQNLTIPSKVTSIEYAAFACCYALEKIQLPAGITTVEDWTFESCKKLKEMVIPSGVTSIGDYALMHCYALEKISLPDGLQTIGANAFFDDWALTEIVIPDSVTEIGESAFTQCKVMKKAKLPAGLTEISSSLFQGCTQLSDVTLPSGVRKIGESAFYRCGLTKVVLPDGLERIEEFAFANCSQLIDVTIPGSVNFVGADVFTNTAYEESLSDQAFVVLGNGLLYLYHGNTPVVDVPSGVISIADSVFKEHEEITEVRLPDSLRTIGNSAFEDCTSLKKVTVPSGVTFIGGNAFAGTAFLADQKDGLVMLGRVAYAYCGDKNVEECEIPAGTVSISDEAFLFCASLEKVMIPDGVTSIGTNAFLGCVALEYVEIPDSVTEIGERAFGYYCGNGSSGTYLSMSVTLAGHEGSAAQAYAENGAGQAEFLSLDTLSGTCGDGLAWNVNPGTGELSITGSGEMKDYSSYGSGLSPFFAYRKLITSVTVAEGVTSLGNEAFYGLGNVKTTVLPHSLTSIGDYAFENCVALETLTLQEKVSRIGRDILRGCRSIQSVSVAEENETYSAEDGILYDKQKTELLAVPDSLPQEILRIPGTVKRISEYAARENRHLKGIYVPESVSYIGNYAFDGCLSLKSLVFSGAAPEIIYQRSLNTEGIAIYCSFSNQGWQNVMQNFTSPEKKTWVDRDSLTGVQVLELEAEKETAAVGESLQLRAKLDPELAVDFVWSSSRPAIAGVNEDGMLLAYRPGEVTISVSSRDGQYRAEKSFTITGEDYVFPDVEVSELPAEVLSYTSIYTETMQIPSPQRNGIYFLSGNRLLFYSLALKQSVPVHTFPGCTNAYSTGEKLYVVYNQQCMVYDLIKGQTELTFQIPGYTATAVGADASGRIYVAANDSNRRWDHRIFLYTPDGTLLSRMSSGTEVYRFSGFDSTNGNFYIEVYYDFYSWGYSHPGMALRMGRVTDNVIRHVDVSYSFTESGMITRTMDNLYFLCQDVNKKHQNNAALLGNRYLTAVSVIHGEVRVMDSWADPIHISASFLRAPVENDQGSSYSDTSSVGVRTVYHEGHDSLILYENGCQLKEYDIETGRCTAQYGTAHPVFDMFWMEDMLVLIEKEGDRYYTETIDWSDPQEIRLSGESTMQVGDSQQLEVSIGKPYTAYYEWSSSDQSVVSVSGNGNLAAWKPGTAEITVSNKDKSLAASFTVTVKPGEGAKQEGGILTVQGTISNNRSRNYYQVWSSPMNSYLAERDDQLLERVEYIEGTGVVIETCSSDGICQNSRTVKSALPLFGGFFAGEDYNFLVFGQENRQENNKCEIMRVIKYSKNWEELGTYSVYGANTYIPFEAGSLRMTETAGKLYIHTCHEMYMSEDGLNHQANMTFVVDEENMTELDSFYQVLNISQAGYVSHSFNQFIRTDGTYVYRVDHGDAGPRAVALTRAEVNGKITKVLYTLPVVIGGMYGDNATGVSVGGFELSADNCLIAGNSVDQTDKATYSAYGQRNIFLSITKKDLTKRKTIWLTDYTEADSITPRTPQLVRINDLQFLLLWEEYNEKTQDICTRMTVIDGDGNQISEIIATDMRLSDCQPIVTADRMVKWYVTDGTSLQLCAVNPYQLEKVARPESCTDSHTWDAGTVLKEPACEETGECEYHCIKCGKTKVETIPETGHLWSGWSIVSPDDKIMSRTCVICDKTETRTYEKDPDNSGDWIDDPDWEWIWETDRNDDEDPDDGFRTGTIPKLNVSGTLPIQVKQSVTLRVVNMKAGDAVQSWESSNPQIVKVSQTGKVRALKKTGKAVLTVTLKNGKSTKITVKVQKAPVKTKKITGLKKSLRIRKGQKLLLKPVLNPITSKEKVKWQSSNKKVVTVSAKGSVKGVRPGKAKLTVKSGKAKFSITVTVTK